MSGKNNHLYRYLNPYIIHWNNDNIALDPMLITNYYIDLQIIVFIYVYA
jgi:hypothetical protein